MGSESCASVLQLRPSARCWSERDSERQQGSREKVRETMAASRTRCPLLEVLTHSCSLVQVLLDAASQGGCYRGYPSGDPGSRCVGSIIPGRVYDVKNSFYQRKIGLGGLG